MMNSPVQYGIQPECVLLWAAAAKHGSVKHSSISAATPMHRGILSNIM